MKIIKFPYTRIPDLPETVLAAGYFDGLHKGHMALLEAAKAEGERLHLPWGVLTFEPDPWKIFKPEADLRHIFSLQDKEAMAEKAGADIFCILEFSRSFAALRPDQFHQLLHQMHCRMLVCGFDFRYGSKNSGSRDTLDACDLPHIIVESVDDETGKISSTRIEKAIQNGNMEKAAAMLGQYYSIPGTIEHGFKRGNSLLNIPTANLKPEPGYIEPCQGVYAGYVLADDQIWPAMINVGPNPTFENTQITMEAYLIGFSGSLYGKKVRFFFGPKFRGEMKFPSVDALKAQLHQDIHTASGILDQDPAMKSRLLGLWRFHD